MCCRITNGSAGVCQVVREGEAGVQSAEWAGWAEGVTGASQEKERCRFPATMVWSLATGTSGLLWEIILRFLLPLNILLSQGCIYPYTPAVHCCLVSPVLLFILYKYIYFF